MLSISNGPQHPMPKAVQFRSTKVISGLTKAVANSEAIKTTVAAAALTAGTMLAMQTGRAPVKEADIEKVREEIKELQKDLKYQMAHPPKTRDPHDWGYYNIYMDRLQSKIADLRKICPLDKTNLEEVLMATPKEIFNPTAADNIKGQGISFLQSLPEDPAEIKKNTYRVVPMLTRARTVEDLIKIGKRDGINIELVQDEKGEYFLGIKNIWSNGYFRIDRDSVVMKYGPQPLDWTSVGKEWATENSFLHPNDKGELVPHVMDCAVIANADGLKILEKSYVHEGGGRIGQEDMHNWGGYNAHKDPKAVVNAVAWEAPRTIQTLEGPITVDATMGDVEGYAYNNFAQLVKQIQKNKIKANPADSASVKFCELIMEAKGLEGEAQAQKLAEAKALLIESTKS